MIARRILAVGILFVGTSAFADEKADIAAVEKEIALQDEARTIYERAKKRAWAAIRKSSLARRYANAKEAAIAARRKYESTLSGTYHHDLLKKKWQRLKAEENALAKRAEDIARTMTIRFWKEELKGIYKEKRDALYKKFDALKKP